jgi:hypothetical protein
MVNFHSNEISYGPSIKRKGNTIFIRNFNHPRNVSDFLSAFQDITNMGYEELTVNLSEIDRFFPNASVPVAAIIDHYKDNGIEISIINRPGIIRVSHFDQPLLASSHNLSNEPDYLSRIWIFEDEIMISRLVTAFVKAISERIECSDGVLEALNWCLSEVMDNVLQHSKSPKGFVMVQVHTEQKVLAICISDTGIGIYGSLFNSKHKPRNDLDAITLSLKEGVTRDTNIGQGNGLWGLYQIVKENSGLIALTSGSGLLRMNGTEVSTHEHVRYIDRNHKSTVIDFQIDASRPIDLSHALSGYRPVNLRLEDLENERGEYQVRIIEHAHGTGTRRSAEQIRNYVVNIINEGSSKIILDFTDVGVISSSFADEFIAKLVARYGFYGFQRLISLQGMNETIQGIVHRSVAQRMMESLPIIEPNTIATEITEFTEDDDIT